MYSCIGKDDFITEAIISLVFDSLKLGKLREEKKSVLSSQPIASPQRLIRLCLITGLLCQYCDFDQKLEMKDKSGRLFKLCQVCDVACFHS
jgi:hypothetical protein